MKKIRFTPLIIISIGLLFASLGVLGNWAFKTFLKDNEDNAGEMIVLKPIDSLETMEPAADLMRTHDKNKKKVSAKTTTEAGNTQKPMNTGLYQQAKTTDDETAVEINKLKTAIGTLSKKNTNNADLTEQITALQQRIDKLVDKNSNVENENKRLFAVLKKLSDDKKETEQTIKTWPVVFENKTVQANSLTISSATNQNDTRNSGSIGPAMGNSLGVADMHLTALTVTDNKEIETFHAYQTDKLVGSVTLKNNSFQNNTGEIFIVVLQPDGRVIQKSTWESGTFQSRDGKKIYSCRIHFDNSKGETKRLLFSLNAAAYVKGNYIMQVYSKGVLIGKMVKALS